MRHDYAGAVLALCLLTVSETGAQQVVSRGYAERVTPAASSLLLRQITRNREVVISPQTRITINGQPGTLRDVAYNAVVEVIARVDKGGRLQAQELTVRQANTPAPPVATARRSTSPPPRAATPPVETPSSNSVRVTIRPRAVRGEVVGVHPAARSVILRINNGFQTLSLRNARLVLDGRSISLDDLVIGDQVEISNEQVPGRRGETRPLVKVTTPQAVANDRQTVRQPGPAAGSNRGTPEPAPEEPERRDR